MLRRNVSRLAVSVAVVGVLIVAVGSMVFPWPWKDRVTVQLRIDASTSVAHLVFINNSRKAAYINKYDACLDGQMSSEVLIVRASDGTPPRTTFQTVHRIPIEANEDDYRLEPGKSIEATIKLSAFFELHPGTTYIAKYSALHASQRTDDILRLTSNEVKFLAVSSK